MKKTLKFEGWEQLFVFSLCVCACQGPFDLQDDHKDNHFVFTPQISEFSLAGENQLNVESKILYYEAEGNFIGINARCSGEADKNQVCQLDEKTVLSRLDFETRYKNMLRVPAMMRTLEADRKQSTMTESRIKTLLELQRNPGAILNQIDQEKERLSLALRDENEIKQQIQLINSLPIDQDLEAERVIYETELYATRLNISRSRIQLKKLSDAYRSVESHEIEREISGLKDQWKALKKSLVLSENDLLRANSEIERAKKILNDHSLANPLQDPEAKELPLLSTLFFKD